MEKKKKNPRRVLFLWPYHMSKKIKLLFILFYCFWSNTSFASPKRIMSLSPVATEMLFALGEGEHIIGVTKFCDYPKEALSKPVLSDFAEINYETILRAKVDLLVLQDMHQQAEEDLQALGVNYVIIRQNSVKDIMNGITLLGKICGKENRAKNLVNAIQLGIAKIRKKVRKGQVKKTKSVLLCVSRNINEEEIYNFYAVGSDVFYNELLTIAGAKNVLCELPVQYPLMTIDGVMTLKPDVIFDLVGDAEKNNNYSANPNLKTERISRAWKASLLNRKLNVRVIPLIGSKFLRPGPRIVEILRVMYNALNSN